MNLRLDWCSHDAAKYAVVNWHYSKMMPHSKLVKIGVWEDEVFIGAVVFGMGATPELCEPYRLKIHDVCELVRVALREHKTHVTRIVSIALRMLRKHCPKLKLCVSFADPRQNHEGKIYQAGNWIYAGMTLPTQEFWYDGRWIHGRAASLAVKQTGIPRAKLLPRRRKVPGKHRYLMVLDDRIRQDILKFQKPFPKRAGSVEIDTPVVQTGEGGANPTPALHENHEEKE